MAYAYMPLNQAKSAFCNSTVTIRAESIAHSKISTLIPSQLTSHFPTDGRISVQPTSSLTAMRDYRSPNRFFTHFATSGWQPLARRQEPYGQTEYASIRTTL